MAECDVGAQLSTIDVFAATREKDRDGVNTAAFHVTSLAELLRLPLPAAVLEPVYAQMLQLAVALNATFMTMVPYAENVVMRGWPMKIKSDVLEFDAFQAGHIGEAVALAAERAALRGEHGTAASLAHSVAAFLHDSFLTADLRRTKVAAPGTVVYVPAGAPDGRRARYQSIFPERPCLDQPQALNKGLVAAAAAVALRRACAAIDWSLADWHLEDADGAPLGRETYLEGLEEFVAASARVLRASLRVHRTGASPRDAYPGPAGTKWYKWKYRDVSGCPEHRGRRRKDRWEDIAHSQHVLSFAASARALGRDYFGQPNRFGIRRCDLRRFLATALNRLLVDRRASGGARFACDVAGSTTNNKSCGKGRALGVRHEAAIPLLNLAISLRDDPGSSCGLLSLVDGVLPLFIGGHPDFFVSTASRNCKQSVLLQAKYYFYWYRAGRGTCPW